MYNLNKELKVTGLIKDKLDNTQMKIYTYTSNDGRLSLLEGVFLIVIVIIMFNEFKW